MTRKNMEDWDVHNRMSDNPIRLKALPFKEKEYVIFWERMANSGVIQSCMASSPKEAVEKCGWAVQKVKHTVIEKVPNSKIETFGVRN